MMRDGCTLETLGGLITMAFSMSLAGLKVNSYKCLNNIKLDKVRTDGKWICGPACCICFYISHAELIITAGSKNIPPVPIEDRIKLELPFLSNVMLIGDKRKFISCFVTLKVSESHDKSCDHNSIVLISM